MWRVSYRFITHLNKLFARSNAVCVDNLIWLMHLRQNWLLLLRLFAKNTKLLYLAAKNYLLNKNITIFLWIMRFSERSHRFPFYLWMISLETVWRKIQMSLNDRIIIWIRKHIQILVTHWRNRRRIDASH